jgi:hypothetical protein
LPGKKDPKRHIAFTRFSGNGSIADDLDRPSITLDRFYGP